MNRIVPVAALGILLLVWTDIYSFEVSTHRALSERAVRSSSLDEFVRSQLSMPGGINELFAGRRIFEWVQEGSEREDDSVRFFNHFHNPLRTWDQAGLGIVGGSSSVLWGQNAGQGFAWQDARDRYFQGLTSTSPFFREQPFAATFQTLGQLIHLPQDAAVPAHTRNDSHAFFEGFERFALGITGTALFDQLTLSSIGFDSSILNVPQNPLATIPIARIIDTTDPEQAQATPSAGTNQGMAEYSNANFLSGDSIFKDFTFPRLESLDLANPVVVNNRRYFRKVADGETGFLLAGFVAEGSFTERLLSLLSNDKGFVLDQQVYQDYASLLLPRAVGYSAGLLDYFFRGRMEVLQDADTPAGPTEVRLKVRNSTPNEGSGMGQIVAVVKPTGQDFYVVSAPQTVNLTAGFQEIGFDFGSPFFFFPQLFTVVYKGPLGMEEQAVIAKTFKPRVARICDGRSSGKFCFSSWKVPSLAATLLVEARGLNNSGEVTAQAANEDGEPLGDDLIYPVSFTAPGTFSFTAPTANNAVRSQFFLQTTAEAGGFVCFFDVTSASPGLEGVDSFGLTSGICPQ